MENVSSAWRGRDVAIATKHRKELVISPPLERLVGMRTRVAPGIDTDLFGTFDGRTPRRGTLQQAAIEKARFGARLAITSAAIASEGAYGPHPTIPFMTGGMEVLVLVDRELDLIVTEQLVVHRPVFISETVEAGQPIDAVVERARFPSHALMVGFDRGAERREWVATGVQDREELEAAICDAARRGPGAVRLASDMRADRNPTRMTAIAEITELMANRLLETCPACGTGGFGWVAHLRGLPCEVCDTPTSAVRGQVLGCPRCRYTEERPREDGQFAADAGSCPTCHP